MSPARLSGRAREAMAAADTTCFVSAASAWEIAIKVKAGKLSLPQTHDMAHRFGATLTQFGFLPLPVDHDDASLGGRLETRNEDPFDRLLVAQALRRDLGFVSIETFPDELGCCRIW